MHSLIVKRTIPDLTNSLVFADKKPTNGTCAFWNQQADD